MASQLPRLRCLDLYAGVGAAGAGYALAGFDVVGVDIALQPRNPHPCFPGDVLALDKKFLRQFDLVHASPPCQAHTDLKTAPGAKVHEDLIPATRALLRAAGVPYVIENVEGAPLIDPVVLCGSHFDLGADAGGTRFHLRRHRLFEASFPIVQPPCRHQAPVIGIYGGHCRCRAAKHGGRGTRDFAGVDKPALAHAAMGVTWSCTMDEISQAVPPAMTRYCGEQFLAWRATRICPIGIGGKL